MGQPAQKEAPGFCRDCLTPASARDRCRKCGSPRIVRHAEIEALSVAHLDCDAFYAAIEKRDNPELRDLPVIVGGSKRGVVATACYIARVKGVRSAMPMFQALQRCPEAVVVPPNMDKYAAVGRQVRAMMLVLTPQVEAVSIDEAFLDLAGTEKLHHSPPAVVLAGLARRIEDELGITVSIGLSFNKFLAKVASDLNKPRGFSVVGRSEALTFLAELPVGRIWGVGSVMQRQLADDGIRTIGQLQTMDEASLVRRYGSIGGRLYRLSRAEDYRKVDPRGEAKSVSAETTFESDISDRAELRVILRHLSERVSTRLKKAGLAGRNITLKLKTADFRTRTRSRQLDDPTRLADRIFRVGSQMLNREAGGISFRLIGIGIADFADPALADPADLVDRGAKKRQAAEIAMDDIRAKFGRDAVDLGFVHGSATRRPHTTLAARDEIRDVAPETKQGRRWRDKSKRG